MGDAVVEPSSNLAELLEQLGTLNDRHEQLRALVEALEVREISLRERFNENAVFSFSLEKQTQSRRIRSLQKAAERLFQSSGCP